MPLELFGVNRDVADRARTIVAEDRKVFAASNTPEVRRAREFLRSRIAQGAKAMFSEVVTLTPAMAEIILNEHNKDNRPIKINIIQKWANEIREGRWKLTSQGISFSPEGMLNNGQHRCLGVVAAGRPVPMNFTFGEPRDAFLVHDTGAARTAADVLSIKGEANCKVLAGAARALFIIERGGRGNQGLTNEQVAMIVDQNPALAVSAALGHSVGSKLKASPSGIVTAHFLIKRDTTRGDRIDEFFDKLKSGAGLDGERNPILVLRNGLMGRQFVLKPGSNQAARVAACTIIAWNLWARGKKTVSVRWADGTDFPAVV